MILYKIEVNGCAYLKHIRSKQMECSICFNAITSETGKVELSCSHPFHFSCLTKWFSRQKAEHADENCPMCRHTANDFEKMPGAIVEPQDDDNETITYGPTLMELAAQERARERFAKYKFLNPQHEVEAYSANLIKACWRGYQDRLLFKQLTENIEDLAYYSRVIKNTKSNIQGLEDRNRFLKAAIGLSRFQVKNKAAIRIQALWRRHKVTALMKEGPLHIKLTGIWRKVTSTKWERVVINPEEDIPATMILHPQSTISQSNLSITIATFEADIQEQLARFRNMICSR